MRCKHYNAWAGVCRNEGCPSFQKSCNDYERPVMCKYSAEKESRMIAALSKLPKMVTDDPKGNFEVMLNLVYGKDGWSYIRYGDEDMQITDFCFKELCPKFGYPEFADQTMTSEEQDQLLSDCVFDICPVATVYAALSGYSHLRDRLRKHEDAMTNRVLTLEEVRNSEVDTFGTVMHWLELQSSHTNTRTKKSHVPSLQLRCFWKMTKLMSYIRLLVCLMTTCSKMSTVRNGAAG